MWAAIAYAAVMAVSQVSQGMQQKKMLNAQAQGYDAQADAVLRSSQYSATRKAEENKRLSSTQEAELLNSGAELNGSPLDFLVDQGKQMELDRQMILYNGQVQANQYRHQAALARSQGSNALRNGYMGAATSILGTMAMAGANGAFSGSTAGATSQASTQSLTQAGNFYNPSTGTITMYSPNLESGPVNGGFY